MKNLLPQDDLEDVVLWLTKARRETVKLLMHARAMADDLGGNRDELEALAKSKAQLLDLLDRSIETVVVLAAANQALSDRGRPPKLIETLRAKRDEFNELLEQLGG